MQPLDASRVPPAATPTMDLPRPAAGVHIVETTLSQRPPVPVAAPAAPTTAPRPVAGLSVRGQPTGGGAPAPQPAPAAPPAPAPAASAAPEKKDGDGGDDASARFSLLELD